MTDLLLVLPIIVPLITGILALFAWKQRTTQRIISVVGATMLFGVGMALLIHIQQNGIQATSMGNWDAPYGIILVADLLSAIMVAITGLMGIVVIIYSLGSIDARREAHGYYPLMNLLLMGVCGAFLTGDLFNLYVWFEVLLISSFVLLALGGERAQLEGAIKYMTLNLMASILFLMAVGITYGIAGTLTMADLSRVFAEIEQPALVTGLAMLLLTAFGIKSAIFPLFFWLPASYHVPPVPVTAIFSALLTKVGVYALIRVFTLLFSADTGYTHTIILVLAGLTMITGVLGAVAQYEMRRLLSFHIVSQIGYLLMGLGLFTQLALGGAVFFMVHVILAKTALFLVSGIVKQLRGTYELTELGGLYRLTPWLAILFIIPALSLAGIPPLSGFWAKFALVNAGLNAQSYLIVGVSLAVGLLTLFSMTKIWAEAFWKEVAPEETTAALRPLPRNVYASLIVPTAIVGLLTIIMGLGAEPAFALSMQAADQLLNPDLYIQAVLQGGI
ncbi:MAG: Na+/H+ antiporter subunit D [Chloroflexi bacterium AL-W]|nr:Na+/H+ antiporter subunit D [Chloroflexi bacterium AL-N1]NOK69646.1 Na+/H+ antiporter subunit D [Chloroflexi bacterium AL-N10]NOK72193.1 Na+/H+ antiporter subunit D [Chloroflexi bacterium AL-N5]NOK85022.1 Na+/H+ antiporter subunit D [Chloroflexi bacterium AL-W]NOK91775.1 Na+/H+ antiporter subunit D [Chloroflexi bacterium AL-N15]